jgi:xylose isomerase
MREQLRIAICYWHSFCWPGDDVFDDGCFERPWFEGGSPMELAERRLSAAFVLFEKLGAATNPDPEVFAFAAAQVKSALEATQWLGGANYVPWGGREGYDTLLNTDLRRELENLVNRYL